MVLGGSTNFSCTNWWKWEIETNWFQETISCDIDISWNSTTIISVWIFYISFKLITPHINVHFLIISFTFQPCPTFWYVWGKVPETENKNDLWCHWKLFSKCHWRNRWLSPWNRTTWRRPIYLLQLFMISLNTLISCISSWSQIQLHQCWVSRKVSKFLNLFPLMFTITQKCILWPLFYFQSPWQPCLLKFRFGT